MNGTKLYKMWLTLCFSVHYYRMCIQRLYFGSVCPKKNFRCDLVCVLKRDPIWLVYKPNTSFQCLCAHIGVLLGTACVQTKHKLQSVCLYNNGRPDYIRICFHRV